MEKSNLEYDAKRCQTGGFVFRKILCDINNVDIPSQSVHTDAVII